MAKWWENFPWRVIQTNMRELDMQGLDAEKFVSDLKAFHANAVMVSFGGTLANYVSVVPDCYPNPYLALSPTTSSSSAASADTSSLKSASGTEMQKLVQLCHKEGIKVIARTDFSKMHKSIFEKHPDWAYREGDDLVPLDSNGYISTCQNGGFQQNFMDEVITEIITKFKVDGIYCNMGGFMVVDYNEKLHGPCQCENCRRSFKEKFGMDLPKKDLPFASMADPSVQAYQKFKGMVAANQKKRVAALIKSIDPNVAYCSVDYVRQESNTSIGRALPFWQYSASSNTRTIIGCGFGADNADVDMMGFTARETSVSPALQEYRLWQALANFGGLDYFIMGRLDNKKDTSAYDRVKRVFTYAYQHEELLKNAKSTASVLLVRDSYQIPNPEERGWIRLLTELHIPFDETLSSALVNKIKQNYKLIVLPEKPRLSAELCNLLNIYISENGMIIATGKASTGLTALGVKVEKPVVAEGCYLAITDSDKTTLPDLQLRGQLPMGKGYNQYTNLTATGFCPIMPAQKFGPPEVCYCQEEPTGLYGVLVNNYGNGKTVYLPWNIGSIYYTEGYDIWFDLAKSVLVDVLGIKQVAKNLSPMVEVTVGMSKGKTLISLVNGTGHFGTSFFDPVSIYDVEIELPANAISKGKIVVKEWDCVGACQDGACQDCAYIDSLRCESLVKKDNCTVQICDGMVRILVKELGFFEQIIVYSE